MFYASSHYLISLTPREIQVMWLLVRGMPNKICAEKLGCSTRTIEIHRARVFQKLGVRNVLEMTIKLHKFGV
ncbi:LuxR C-terminal-related transcriptional regulator [Pelistega europaea]|uniref:Helix-turn-helix transcriptional regulator n=1 Tax=Pelistega europaea TaxID=106147 RepID=A0A7Y4LBB2_9BURK|nr:helix-turn-helix transcriptional regulator [Pelistega europaea]NOL50388.1 helix-turn-helix transcriptional regulator [Pelistega europaea]